MKPTHEFQISVSINAVLLVHSHIHPIIYYQWLVLVYTEQ